jgi:hypothetical protein
MFNQFSTFGAFMPQALAFFILLVIILLFLGLATTPVLAPEPTKQIVVSVAKQNPQKESFSAYVPASVNDKYTIDVDEELKKATFINPELRQLKTNDLIATTTLDNSKNISDIYLSMYKPQFVPQDQLAGPSPYEANKMFDITQPDATNIVHQDTYPTYENLQPMYANDGSTMSPLVNELISFDTTMRTDYQRQLDRNQAAQDAKALM